VSFREDYFSSSKAQSEAQTTQLNDLRNDLERLSGLVTELKKENSALRIEVDVLKGKVASFESKEVPDNTLTIISQIMQENLERKKCLSNVIVYGLSESTSSPIPQRIEDNKVALLTLLERFNISPVFSKVMRLSRMPTENSH